MSDFQLIIVIKSVINMFIEITIGTGIIFSLTGRTQK